MSNVIDTVFLGDVIVNLVDACPIELMRAIVVFHEQIHGYTLSKLGFQGIYRIASREILPHKSSGLIRRPSTVSRDCTNFQAWSGT